MIASKITFLFGAAAAVSALVVPRKDPPAGWWTEGLEDYNVYHTRYLALGCQNQHGKEFFDLCCHPLKKDETLETARAPECIPSASASVSASLAEPTSTVTTPDDEPPTSATSGSESSAASPSSIVNVASGDDGDESCDPEDEEGDEDGDDEECEPDDEDENGSSAPSAPSSTPAPESTSSEAPAPQSTSSEEEHTSSKAPPFTPEASSTSSHEKPKETPSSTTSADKSEETSSSSQGSGQTFTGGFATFYYQGGTAGACGDYNSDDALIAAMDSSRYGDTSQQSDLCGKQVKITNTDNGKSVTVTIADACPTCENGNSIDLSTGAFDKIADRQTGMVPISWQFV